MQIGGGTWTDTRLCGRCKGLSTYMGFRSHCRLCGASVCSSCVSPETADKWSSLPFVRLCDSIPDTHVDRPFKACRACAGLVLHKLDVCQKTDLLIQLVPYGVHRQEWAALAQVPSSAPICVAARSLGSRLHELVCRQEFASRGYEHDATDAALIKGDADMHVYDMVYTTSKALHADKHSRVPALPLCLVLSILHREGPTPWSVRACMSKMRHCIPAIFELVHHATRQFILEHGMLNTDQIQCLHMLNPDDAFLPLHVPGEVQTLVEKHRSNIAVLSLLSQMEPGAKERKSLTADFIASKNAGLIFQGRFRHILHIHTLNPGHLEVFCEPRKCVHAFVDGVDARLVVGSAFASWALYRAAFQNLVRTASGQCALLVSRPALANSCHCSYQARVKNWVKGATEGSVFMQCQVLTVLQATTKRFIDTGKLLASIDAKGRLLFLRAPLLPPGIKPAGPSDLLPPGGIMDQHTRTMVHQACAALFKNQREHVYWLARLLTGEERAVPVTLDSKFTFVF